jgi:N-acetylmuramoyl-L-alanine amidase
MRSVFTAKNLFLAVCFLSVLLTMGVSAEEDGTGKNPRSNYTIGIDPGHQSEKIDMSALEANGPGSSVMKAKCTSGTTGRFTGVPEYKLNLAVALQLRDLLEEMGYKTVMTRTNNETAISNKERALLVSKKSDVCVRIHANGSDDSSVSGAMTMSVSSSNPYVGDMAAENQRLSKIILDHYCRATGFSNRGVMLVDNMTGLNWSTIPNTILEMGFMTNRNDDTLMQDPDMQKKMVKGIAEGIDEYLGIDSGTASSGTVSSGTSDSSLKKKVIRMTRMMENYLKETAGQ